MADQVAGGMIMVGLDSKSAKATQYQNTGGIA